MRPRLFLCLLLCLPPIGCVDQGRYVTPTATSEEMRQQLIGKTKDEVRGLYGRMPNRANDHGEETEWTYLDGYRHPESRSTSIIYIIFRDGKVVRVH